MPVKKSVAKPAKERNDTPPATGSR
jgi:hypothetical protein